MGDFLRLGLKGGNKGRKFFVKEKGEREKISHLQYN